MCPPSRCRSYPLLKVGGPPHDEQREHAGYPVIRPYRRLPHRNRCATSQHCFVAVVLGWCETHVEMSGVSKRAWRVHRAKGEIPHPIVYKGFSILEAGRRQTVGLPPVQNLTVTPLSPELSRCQRR